MNINSNRGKLLRCGALFLLGGVAFSNVGCNSLTNKERLFFKVNSKDLEVVFCDRGASIYSIKYKDKFMTYHPKNIDDYLKDDFYYGKALGRVAGRIKDGDLTVEGKHYQLDVNETDSYYKHNNIHGGKDSLTTRDFKRFITEDKNTITVSFSYVSPSMEAGFPHEVDCRYVYTLYKDTNRLDLDIKGTPSGVTPLNLSNHPYFNLGDSNDILNHELTLEGSTDLAKFKMENNRTDQVVWGTIPLTDSSISPFDFRTAKTIGRDIEAAKQYDLTSGGYDHIWKFGPNNCKVKLKNPENGITLDVDSDADAIIMYANCYPHSELAINDKTDRLYGAITVEPVKFFTKDTIEQDLNCSPDKPYTRHISYKFSGL